ncbi:hypothetical protein BIW11_02514 [Tropilaelaps mercedesae]|uniref:Uncharacterized protein n=1 Tax=Tropilaelaps mercedesae TaxID=418985 RepID=A0A1V9Y212_9ACAR|nr:hypothetical protein BIW11_02514 [Tropilaelaps mercedesae]
MENHYHQRYHCDASMIHDFNQDKQRDRRARAQFCKAAIAYRTRMESSTHHVRISARLLSVDLWRRVVTLKGMPTKPPSSMSEMATAAAVVKIDPHTHTSPD